jgi:hypothetical protein
MKHLLQITPDRYSQPRAPDKLKSVHQWSGFVSSLAQIDAKFAV